MLKKTSFSSSGSRKSEFEKHRDNFNSKEVKSPLPKTESVREWKESLKCPKRCSTLTRKSKTETRLTETRLTKNLSTFMKKSENLEATPIEKQPFSVALEPGEILELIDSHMSEQFTDNQL